MANNDQYEAVEPNYSNLPPQQGFAINIDETELWDYWPDADEDESSPRLNYVFRTPTLSVIYLELPEGTTLPWHTHEPNTAQVYWVMEGKVRANYKDNEGNEHTYEADAEDEQLLYMPAGAHNEVENSGDGVLRFLSFKEGGGPITGRDDHRWGDAAEHYDPEEDLKAPMALDIFPTRGEIFEMQDGAVEEY